MQPDRAPGQSKMKAGVRGGKSDRACGGPPCQAARRTRSEMWAWASRCAGVTVVMVLSVVTGPAASAQVLDAGAPADAAPDALPMSSGRAEVAEAPRSAPKIRITGTAVLPESVARTAIGSLPNPGEDLQVWGEQAARRIVDAYRARGFLYARAWFSSHKLPGVLWFDVDEGRMRVSFSGIGTISATLFRLRLNLPGSVFQKDDLERSLAEQKKALRLSNIYYRVHELEGYEVTIFGQVVPARTLEIHVVRRESFGWGLDVSVSAAWGVLPSAAYAASGLLWPDDRLNVKLEVAFPYRRYIFDAAPRITWVHGGLAASYRLPRLGYRTVDLVSLAPRVDMSVYVSQYSRADLRLDSFYLVRNVPVANLVAPWPDGEVSLGLGADLAGVFSLKTAATAGQEVSPPPDTYSTRGLFRAAGNWTSAVPWSRRDRRTVLKLMVDVCAPLEVRATLTGQYFVALGRHRLFVRGRAVGLFGHVPFWDDVELAGDYQRVFFNDLYWAHRAAQLEVAYLVKLWRDWFEVGIFHDVTLFEDRISVPPALRVMDAFGPSLHFLILDVYALGIHQGLGFAPGKFSQTISFTVETVF
jgi:hypothetical protein